MTITDAELLLDREQRRALVVLMVPISFAPHRMGAGKWRELYRGAGTNTWFATYSTDLDGFKPFSASTMIRLNEAGLIESVFPHLDQPLDCVRITPAGRAALGAEG